VELQRIFHQSDAQAKQKSSNRCDRRSLPPPVEAGGGKQINRSPRYLPFFFSFFAAFFSFMVFAGFFLSLFLESIPLLMMPSSVGH
jgi:hypothetical protein